MTNTTRTLTFRNEDDEPPHHTVSTTTPLYRGSSGMVLAIYMHGDAFPSIEYDREQLAELLEFGRDVMAATNQRGDDGVQDARILCGARHGERLVCILDEDHAWPTALGPHGHVSADGTAFLVNPDADDLPH